MANKLRVLLAVILLVSLLAVAAESKKAKPAVINKKEKEEKNAEKINIKAPKQSKVKADKPVDKKVKAKDEKVKTEKVKKDKVKAEKVVSTKTSKVKQNQAPVFGMKALKSKSTEYQASKKKSNSLWSLITWFIPLEYEETVCKTVKGVKKCKTVQHQSFFGMLSSFVFKASLYMFGIMFSIFGCLACCGAVKVTSGIDLQIKKLMEAFEEKLKSAPSTLSQSQKQDILTQLQQDKFMIAYTNRKRIEINICSTFVKVDKVNDVRYDVELKGFDWKGTCKLKGIIMFTEEKVAIKLVKVYDNKEKAGQVGELSLPIYQAIGSADLLEGVWGYPGLETSDEHSGFCKMTKAK